MFKLAGRFLHFVLPGIVRPLHVLWNQVIGFLFLALACLPLPSLIRTVREGADTTKLFLMVPFILVMAAFGISSFWRARKISRS